MPPGCSRAGRRHTLPVWRATGPSASSPAAPPTPTGCAGSTAGWPAPQAWRLRRACERAGRGRPRLRRLAGHRRRAARPAAAGCAPDVEVVGHRDRARAGARRRSRLSAPGLSFRARRLRGAARRTGARPPSCGPSTCCASTTSPRSPHAWAPVQRAGWPRTGCWSTAPATSSGGAAPGSRSTLPARSRSACRWRLRGLDRPSDIAERLPKVAHPPQRPRRAGARLAAGARPRPGSARRRQASFGVRQRFLASRCAAVRDAGLAGARRTDPLAAGRGHRGLVGGRPGGSLAVSGRSRPRGARCRPRRSRRRRSRAAGPAGRPVGHPVRWRPRAPRPPRPAGPVHVRSPTVTSIGTSSTCQNSPRWSCVCSDSRWPGSTVMILTVTRSLETNCWNFPHGRSHGEDAVARVAVAQVGLALVCASPRSVRSAARSCRRSALLGGSACEVTTGRTDPCAGRAAPPLTWRRAGRTSAR